MPREADDQRLEKETSYPTMTAAEPEDTPKTNKVRSRYSVWTVMHRMQGFETRFGLKTTVVTSLLSIPAWLGQTSDWWDEYELWWAVVMAWLIMAPRYVLLSPPKATC